MRPHFQIVAALGAVSTRSQSFDSFLHFILLEQEDYQNANDTAHGQGIWIFGYSLLGRS